MDYDVFYRFGQALSPAGLDTIETMLHAINAAVRDCEAAGKATATDPAVLLLIQRLGAIGAADPRSESELRAACAKACSDLAERPALLTLAGVDLAHFPAARRTVHFQARRALAGLAEALGLVEAECRIRTDFDTLGGSGATSLHHDELFVVIRPTSFVAGEEILFGRCVHYSGEGPVHIAPIGDLATIPLLARRIEAAIGQVGPAQRRAA